MDEHHQNQAKGDETTAYFVNTNKGHLLPHGERLDGKEILARAGFSSEKYELFTLIDGKTGVEIKADQQHDVKPGDHYRGTIRGADYSCVPPEGSGVPR
jgi:hypothetical protein